MTPVRIRPALAADLPRLAELERSGFAAAWSAGDLGAALASPASLALVAESAPGAPLGFVLFLAVLDEAELLRMAVAPEARRRGLGRALVVAGLHRLAAAGTRTCRLEVRPSNQAARRLYEGLGFRLVGRRPAYYADREDALLYALGQPFPA